MLTIDDMRMEIKRPRPRKTTEPTILTKTRQTVKRCDFSNRSKHPNQSETLLRPPGELPNRNGTAQPTSYGRLYPTPWKREYGHFYELFAPINSSRKPAMPLNFTSSLDRRRPSYSLENEQNYRYLHAFSTTRSHFGNHSRRENPSYQQVQGNEDYLRDHFPLFKVMPVF